MYISGIILMTFGVAAIGYALLDRTVAKVSPMPLVLIGIFIFGVGALTCAASFFH